MYKKLTILLLLSLQIVTSLEAASFNCAKASTLIEHSICNDKALSKFDEDLAQAYKMAKKNTSNPELLKQEQISWMKQQRNTCPSVQCLTDVYQKRIYALNNYKKVVVPSMKIKSGSYLGEYGSLTIKKDLSFDYIAINERSNMCILEGEFSDNDKYLLYNNSGCNMKVFQVDKNTIKIEGSCEYGSCGMGTNIYNEELVYDKANIVEKSISDNTNNDLKTDTSYVKEKAIVTANIAKKSISDNTNNDLKAANKNSFKEIFIETSIEETLKFIFEKSLNKNKLNKKGVTKLIKIIDKHPKYKDFVITMISDLVIEYPNYYEMGQKLLGHIK